jgi:hypothetical protein
MQRPFEQNVIAIIWDFDKTLAKDYMQKPIFEKYGVNERDFWNENNSLVEKYKEKGINVNKDTIYLNHLLTCVEQGVFEGLNNSLLRELGKKIAFYEGIPDFFSSVKRIIEESEKYKKYHITLEHYIVSTGLAEMIKGSVISPFVEGIWGCEFIEEPIKSNLEIKEYSNTLVAQSCIKQIAYAIDHTSKTRALFEINKGANKYGNIDVNAKLPPNTRRIPFSNMIYIADGPSDVPAFSIIKQNGGKTFAVYPKGEVKHLNQVDKLREDNRIDMYGEADYQEGTLTYLWITEQVKKIADKIYAEKEEAIKRSSSTVPGHII